MRARSHPLKWPLSLGLALLLAWALFFCVPFSWLDLPFAPHSSAPESGGPAPAPWLILMPEPEILVVGDHPEPPAKEKAPRRPVWQPPDNWWSRGVGVAIVPDSVARTVTQLPDSLRLMLEGWRLGAAALALPDSALQQALVLWQVQESFFPENWKPLWLARGRDWYKADIKSREADLYDEHLKSEIMVPRQGGR